MIIHKETKIKKVKAKSCLFACVSKYFIRIRTLKILDNLKEEYKMKGFEACK
uniref:Uncharacterized protein n=1 Tax=Cajanus cajan TaxID=3821 RepID=A0A151S5D6_CAJCA|nr:hypothetical protein KK1_028227 [Cajanus cajan]